MGVVVEVARRPVMSRVYVLVEVPWPMEATGSVLQ